MPEKVEGELDFATLAIAHKVLSREQVEAAQAILQQEILEGKPKRDLEDVLLERGMLKAESVWAVYKARERLTRDAQSRGQRIGGHEILGKLGEGGLGVVYKARQLSMGRIVALKLLHEKWANDDEFRKRFLVEARLVGRLSHQNLIQVFDVGRYKNTLYYAMEFVDGETVEDMIERDGKIPLPEAIEIMFQIARALQYLHSKGIVHRDVKPGNVMVTRGGVAKLGDFGFVKSSLDSVLSTEGEVLGTPDYISPEAAMGEKDLDFRSDLYSLGATLYHVLSGRPPFGGSGSSVMEAHIKESAPPLRSLRPDLPEQAVQLVQRLMEKDRNKRHCSFAELFEDLEMLRLQTLPQQTEEVSRSAVLRVLARGGTSVEELIARERVLTRQVRLLIYALAGTGTALVAGLAALLWLLWRGGHAG
jgi:eukaryotic-like serine/threonine-protein kinase